jgi:hypothetical protein
MDYLLVRVSLVKAQARIIYLEVASLQISTRVNRLDQRRRGAVT